MGRGCPVCGMEDSEPFASAKDNEYGTDDCVYGYLRCTDCGSVWLLDPPVDKLGEIYPVNYYSFQDQGRSFTEWVKSLLDKRLFRKLLRSISDASLRVLDVGGGSGWLLEEMRSCDARIGDTHIVDIDREAKPLAEKAGHVYHLCRIEEFRSEEKFHIILLLNLLEHVPDPVALLRTLRLLLAPGGVLLIKTPNVATLDARLFRKLYWGGLHCPRHFVLFTRESFLRAGRESGFRCERFWYTQGAPQWTCSVLGSLALFGLVAVSRERPLYRHPLYAPLLGFFAAVDFLRKGFSPTAQMMAVFRRTG